jgi:hypothetical protein
MPNRKSKIKRKARANKPKKKVKQSQEAAHINQKLDKAFKRLEGKSTKPVRKGRQQRLYK